MKKIFVSIVAAMACMGLSLAQQNFKVEADGEAIAKGDTIVVSGVIDDDVHLELEVKLVFANTSSKVLYLQPIFNTDNVPAGGTPMFCARNCFANINNISVIEIEANGFLGRDEDDEDAHIAYTPNADLDIALLGCAFIDTVAHDTLEFFVKFIPQKENIGASIERNELAGVSVYPNPANGVFNLNVPARANVEIFNANGQVVRQMEVAAGLTSMQLGNAGVYFIRVRANGQEAVKRVVVR
ncbi:MAG: T9SS type A sorting domain-containing protein [Bacteroides sp.]|nr:T9SS type A sorting domain-containing protein [Ruminococcus flavefaciens]MCM1555163.1 T9SS type A sorting domain-containing protein [Bacteroides sp.]